MSVSRSQLGWAWSYVRPYRRRVAGLAALSTLEIALRLLAPWTLAYVVDHVLSHAAGTSAARHTALYAFAAIGLVAQISHQVVVLLHGRGAVAVGQRLIRDLREQQFSHAQQLALSHHARSTTGETVSLLEGDARCVEQLVFRGLFPLVFSVLTLVVMFGVLAAIDVHLALLSLAIMPPLFLWLRRAGRRMGPAADHARRIDSRLSSRVAETFAAIRLIRSHAREDHEQRRFSSVAHEAAHAWTRLGNESAAFAIVGGILTAVGTSLILVVGGCAVVDGRLSVGTLLLVLAYLGYVYGPLSAIANTTTELQRAFASARRVRAGLEAEREPPDGWRAISSEQARGEIRFEDVEFAYPGGPPVLQGVTVTAKPGEVVAFVGPSGAGKSTLASLLLRFYEPSAGRITLDGRPLTDYQRSSLRRTISLVLQDAVLLAGTVRDNIRYGRLDASDADIEAAAHAARAHEFIAALPAGYDTVVGEGGVLLSGGQRQRLSLARAFLAGAPVVVLDEPTSALDTIAEHSVVEAMEQLWTGRTTFVIAHRLSTVRRADRIVVLDQGRVVAEGTHAELNRTSLLYRRLAAQLTAPEERELASRKA